MEIESLESIKSYWESVAREKTLYIPEEVSRKIGDVIRVISLFDSKKDIVVCVGMLKSGKSTLINLLSRYPEASPTEQGKDKTLRPALFRMQPEGKEAALRIYYHRETPLLPRLEVFKLLINYLCGVSESFPGQYIEERIEKLDSCILEEVLCRQFDETRFLAKEPLFVVVDLPYNEESLFFQNQERMLLDMPGCDSGYSETTKRQEEYRAIGDECAMVLLLQTNISPLNRNAMEQLHEIFAGRHEKTIRIILNRMDSRTWRTEQSVQDENKSQLSDARRQLEEICGEVKPAWDEANLAMATDGRFANQEKIQEVCKLYGKEYSGKEDLWNGSQFEQLEKSVVENLTNIREIHCWDRLRAGLSSLVSECQLQEKLTQQRIEAGLAKKKDWISLLDFADNFYAKYSNLTQGWAYQLKRVPDFAGICRSGWGNDPRIKTGDEMKVKGEHLDQCMAQCNNKCFEKFEELVSGIVALNDIKAEWEGHSEDVFHAVDDKLKNIFSTLREKIRKKYSCWEEVPEPQRPVSADLREAGIRICKNVPEEKKYVILKQFAGREMVFFNLFSRAKKYEVNSKVPFFDVPVLKPMVEHYKAQIANLDMDYVRDNVNQLMERKFHEVIDKLKAYIQQEHIEKIDKENEAMEGLKNMLADLRASAEKQRSELSNQQ